VIHAFGDSTSGDHALEQIAICSSRSYPCLRIEPLVARAAGTLRDGWDVTQDGAQHRATIIDLGETRLPSIVAELSPLSPFNPAPDPRKSFC
jgi:hypothetical protein